MTNPTAWRRLRSTLRAWAHAFAWNNPHRESFLAASVDLKDYECRLKALDDHERQRAAYLSATHWL